MSKKQHIPALRFPGFEGEWEIKTLDQIGDIVTGSTPSTSEKAYYDGEYLFVSPVDIDASRYICNTKTTLTEIGFSKCRKVRRGSTLFVCIGSTIGKVAQASIECATNQQINAVIPYNNNDDFIYSLLEKNALQIRYLAAEQAVPILNKTSFASFQVYTPSLPEQQKIASFLSAVDEKLQALKRKKELLEQYKKGAMQQIFSQELRFKDANGEEFEEWEEVQLKDVCDVKGGKRIPKGESLQDDPNGYPYITVSDMTNGCISMDNIRYVPISVVDSIKNYTITSEDIFVSVAGTLGITGIIPDILNGANLTENANKLTNIKLDKYFLLHYLNTDSFKELIESCATIGAQPKLAIYVLQGFIVPKPSLPEQQKIAAFLSAMDDKINLVQSQIEKTEAWKKGLLQQLFV